MYSLKVLEDPKCATLNFTSAPCKSDRLYSVVYARAS